MNINRSKRKVDAIMARELNGPRMTFSPFCQWCLEPRIAFKRNLLVCPNCDRPAGGH